MTILVTENCRLCRFTECVAVCPVACFHADDDMVYIDNDVCIDCRACIPVCPVKAILAEEDLAVPSSHAGVFALPSLYEGFGLPLPAATACGAPVVCSNAGPLPEVAGDAALFLKPEDPVEWAATMLDVLMNTSLRAELRRRGFARAKEFVWQRSAQATREVYREALLA